jgi:putative redox protein
MQFSVIGRNVPEAAVQRAVAMSHEKYCSATTMLGKTAEITTGFDIQAS